MKIEQEHLHRSKQEKKKRKFFKLTLNSNMSADMGRNVP